MIDIFENTPIRLDRLVCHSEYLPNIQMEWMVAYKQNLSLIII